MLSPSERSNIDCKYPNLSESIEFPGNSPGKSHEWGCMLTLAALVVWLCCDMILYIELRLQ